MNNFEKFRLWLVTSDPFGEKNPKISLKTLKFIRASVRQIKKNMVIVGFLDVSNEKCYFLTKEKMTMTNFSAKINDTGVRGIR